jgi:predicted alpha/beta hydrolase family esterase
MLKIYPALFLLFFMLTLPAIASDLAREKRMANEIVDSIIDGEAVDLPISNKTFLGIYTEAEQGEAKAKDKGVAIILHGRGFHPDWQDAINPLRVGLTESGWNTLAIQMPVLEKQAKYYDYVPIFPEALPRIESAIKYAREQGNKKIILIAHSCGAHMAMAWVAAEKKVDKKIDAYVGIGMGATDYKQPMLNIFPLDQLKVPVLDVYAENDYPAVKNMAESRELLMDLAGNKKSKQVVIKNSNHYYVDKGEALTQAISQWLNTLFD